MCMCYSRSTCCLDGLQYLALCLPVRPFSGLIGEAASPPISVFMCPSWFCIFPLAVFLKFCKVSSPISWPFIKILRDPLRSLGFPFDGSCPTFPEEDPKFSLNLMIIFAQAGFPDAINILGGLPSYCRVSILLSSCMASILQSYCPFYFFPVQKGLQISWRHCFANAIFVPVGLLSGLLFCRPVTNKFLMKCLPFYLTGFLM